MPPAARYADYRELIDRERPGLLSITTWAPMHAEIAVYAAEHGVRGIFCEKGLACSPFEDESDTVVAIRELARAVAAGTPDATSGPISAAQHGMELLCAMAESHLREGARVRLPLQDRSAYIPSR